VWAKKLIIDPRLGDLKYAGGTVVTEFGKAAVSWTKTVKGMKFTVDVPKGVSATLKFNGEHQIADLQLNHQKRELKKAGDQYSTNLSGGKWSGSIRYQ
jgi:predicted NUDIX family NTP pyrophosphohydrolase